MYNTIKVNSIGYQKVEEELSKAANNGSLVIFIGAGISKLCGFPLWNETCNMLIDRCVDKRWLSKEEGEQIKKCSDPIMKMSQCRRHMPKEAFNQFLRDVFGKEVPEEYFDDYQRIKNALGALSSVIVTTNIDEIFDCLCLDENRFYSTEHIENIKIIKGIKQIWHIHGSLGDITAIVFTEEQYKERYSDEKVIAAFKRFFDSNNCTVLFVGYGLGDTELLPYFEGDLKNRKNHFFLEGHNKDNDEEFKKKCKICEERGIQVLEYDLGNNEHEKVIDILENLADYMNLESTYPTVRFDEVSRLLIEKPDEESIKFVCEEIYSLLPQHQSWLLHNVSMEGCNPEWLIAFLKNPKLKLLFSVDNDIPSEKRDKSNKSKKSGDKEPWNIKNIRFLLNTYRNTKLTVLLPYIEEIVIGLVKKMITKGKFFENGALISSIISNSFISEKVISEPIMLAFWKKVVELKNPDYYRFFLVANDNLLNCSEEVRESYFEFMFDVVLNEEGYQTFINGKGIDSIHPFFGDDNALERFEKCREQIIKHKGKNNIPLLLSINFFDHFDNIRNEKCGSNEEINAKEYNAIRVMLYEMTKIPNDKVLDVYNELRNSQIIYERNLAIYFCNLRFDVLKDVLFYNIFDYCDDKNRLEVYSLLQSHKDEIEDEYIDDIHRYILRIIEETDIGSIFDCKLILSFCELFENRCPELKMEKEAIVDSLSEEEKELIKSMPSCLEFTIDDYQALMDKWHSEANKKQVNDMKTWYGLLRFVRANNYDDFSFDIEKWVDTHFDLCELDTFLFDSTFSLESYSVGFINHCFKLYMSRKELQEKKLIMYFDKIKVDSKSLKLVQVFSNYLVENLSQMYSASAPFKSFWRDLFDYSMKNKQYFFLDDSWIKSDSVYTSRGFHLLCFLIRKSDKEDWDKLKAAFHETIKEGNEDSVVIRAAYAFAMARIYTLDQEYLYSILSNVFYGAHEDVIIDVFVGYNKKTIYDSRFYEELQSNRILSFIVSLQDPNERAYRGIISYLSFLVALFIKGNISENVLDEVLSDFKELNIVLGGILKLKEQANKLNEDEAKRIKTILTKIKGAKGVCFDPLVILLLGMMKSSSLLKKCIWKDVLALAKNGFTDTYLDDVKKYFCDEPFLTNEEKIIFLKSVLKKGKVGEQQNKVIEQIFDSVDWSKDKDSFYKLITIIQKQNTELSSQLMGQFKSKYEKSDDDSVS